MADMFREGCMNNLFSSIRNML